MNLKEQDGKYYQQCKVVILATEKGKLIYEDFILKYHPSGIDVGDKKYFNFYILSDEKIKEDDWCYNSNGVGIKNKIIYINSIGSRLNAKQFGWKKIIATTDNSLGLPQPSQSFIKKYIEDYNSDNVIENVLVEYEEYFDNKSKDRQYVNKQGEVINSIILKVDPNHTITIKNLKDNYSREEVENIIIDALLFGTGSYEHMTEDVINNWIKERLE